MSRKHKATSPNEDADYFPKEANIDVDEDVDSDTEVVYVVINQIRGRGRPRLKKKGEVEIPKNKKIKRVFVDEKGNKLTIRHDEVVTPDDPKGEEKITALGELKGGRQFKVRTLHAIGRGDRNYMVSTDIARCVGYRDSYFLFQRHSSLFRVTINDADKITMIKQGVLPTSFKTRAVYLVTARSIYKEFGARVVANGKQVIDDYYEDKAREEGAIEGAPAGPLPEALTAAGSSSSHHGSHKRHEPAIQGSPLGRASANLSVSWIYENAFHCRQFESMMLYDRREAYNNILSGKAEKDTYTGMTFVPSTTQPTSYKVSRVEDEVPKGKKRKLVFDTNMAASLKISTGLKDVPKEIYEGVVDPEVLKAIEDQKAYEATL